MHDAGARTLQPGASIDVLVNRFETGGGTISLFGDRSVRIDAGRFEGRDEDVDELQRRSGEVLGLLASRRPRPPLPASRRFGTVSSFPLAIAQEPWSRTDGLPLSEQWLPMLWNLEGDLDVPAFQRSYEKLIDVHASLRARVVEEDGARLQRIIPPGRSKLRIMDLTHRPESQREYAVWRLMRPYYLKPTPLDKGPVRLVLFKLGDRRHLLGGFVHHVALDGRSQQLFLGELMGRYYGYTLGGPVPEEADTQFSDFVLWEQTCMPPAERALAAAYWEYKLAAASPLQLPGGRYPGDEGSPPDLVAFETSPDFYAALGDYARSRGVTVNVCVLTALSILLGRWAGQSEALFGFVILGRPAGFETTMGCFAQSRPFHLDFNDDPTFEDLLSRARAVFAASSDLRRPVPSSVTARTGFSNVLVNYWAESGKRAGQPPLALRSAQGATGSYVLPSSLMTTSEPRGGEGERPFQAISRAHTLLGLTAGMIRLPRRVQTEFHRNLHIAINQTDRGLRGRITFASDRFARDRVVAFATDLVGLLKQAMRTSAARVSDLESREALEPTAPPQPV